MEHASPVRSVHRIGERIEQRQGRMDLRRGVAPCGQIERFRSDVLLH